MEVRLRWLIRLILCLGLVGVVFAQGSGYSDKELDTLVGPIALFPDPLLNSVVAAAAFPDQLKSAGEAGGGTPNSSWDSSVQALCAYPDVVKMMNSNGEWTQAIGWAGVNQPDDLMDSVQRFRFQTQTAGNLKSDDKMTVIEEGTTIRIEPANPQVIYVPTYQPSQVVYADSSDDGAAAVIGFGVGIATSALIYNNMWHNGAWYHPPVGWRPPPGYATPYGWRGNGGAYAWGNNSYNRNTNINRPVNINNINTGLRDSVLATITRTTDLYFMNGATIPDPTYEAPSTITNEDGSITDTTVLIGQKPDSRTTSTTTDNVSVSNYWKLRGSYISFRAGPAFAYTVSDRFRISFSVGPAMVYVGTNYSLEQTLTPETSDPIIATINDLGDDVLTGYYADANVEYLLSDRAGLYVGAFFQGTGEYEQDLTSEGSTYSTKLDLSSLKGLRAGLNYRF